VSPLEECIFVPFGRNYGLKVFRQFTPISMHKQI
jgi:hypothetical protein